VSVTHKPTTENRAKVAALSSFGITQLKICAYLGISEPTLRKYYGPELINARIDKIVQVANALYHNAVSNNNVTAQIFFLKTQGEWRETNRDETAEKPDIGKIQIEVLNGKAEVKDG